MMKKAEQHAVTLTMSPSAARLSFSVKILNEVPENPEADARIDIQTRGFPSPSLNGFGFMPDWNDLMRLPQAKAPGRRYAGILRQSNFMATSQKLGGVKTSVAGNLKSLLA
jgi:hypothetical protein